MVVQPSIRLLLLSGLIALIACGTYSNARWLIAESYLRFSEQRGQSAETRVAARQASDIAYKLQPFSARALQNQAGNDLFLGQPPQLALNEYKTALTLAPADAYLWRDYALALIYTGVFDQRLERAVVQAQAWGRRSKPIHLSLAVAGLKVFRQSSSALRALWLKSIRIAYWDNPGAMQWTSYIADEDLLLCGNNIIPKPETNAWCAAARWRHGLCADAASCFRKQEQGP